MERERPVRGLGGNAWWVHTSGAEAHVFTQAEIVAAFRRQYERIQKEGYGGPRAY